MLTRLLLAKLLLILLTDVRALSLFTTLKTPDEFRRAMRAAEEQDRLTVLAIKKPPTHVL